MATSLTNTININCDCDSFIFTETTGSYDASTNTGGWGTPNEATSDAVTVTLTIVDDLNSVTYDAIDLSSNFPSSALKSQTINVSDLKISGVSAGLTSFTDGKYSFTYTVTTSTTTYSYKVCKMSLCTIACAIKTLTGAILDNCSCCDNTVTEEKLFKILSLYNSLIFSGAFQSDTKTSEILTLINNILERDNCKNC